MPIAAKNIIVLLLVLSVWSGGQAQKGIPSGRLLTTEELITGLKAAENEKLHGIQALYEEGEREKALEALAAYFRDVFAERYFFDWRKADKRFEAYQQLYPHKKESHYDRADYFTSRYPAQVQWQLPFDNLRSEAVTPYRLRHLARQHKAVDMAMAYYYEGRQTDSPAYFSEQVRSLNAAFEAGAYERQDADGGNGVYEVFRAGYRVLNWLIIHNLYLSIQEYDSESQLEMIRTLLHHGAQLRLRTPEFKYGNHQTRGLSALAMIAILLRDYEGTDEWYAHAMRLLGEHLEKEINSDGFQFERSVHYHLSDIDNYFYVYQLARLNGFEAEPAWERKLLQMFQALVKVAQPDRHAPVLQDDTDDPWAEYNRIGQAMALGAILFDDPEFNYFAADKVEPFKYWFVRDEQLQRLAQRKKQQPAIGSVALESTGYYVMRNGWGDNSQYMIITAGLEENKPAHQHGDMLGLAAYAYGNEILPNYQVRYYLPDLEFFKNSWVKNVAIVDEIPHGRGWTPNSGGSGFGRWEKLPAPQLIAWRPGKELDYFAGSHDGYSDIGVGTQREVLFIKDGFWIVKDHFTANTDHDYQQIWQGHYNAEKGKSWVRSTFTNGAGLEVIQLGEVPDSISYGSQRGKGRAVFHWKDRGLLQTTTLLYPFAGFETRIPEEENLNKFNLKGWRFLNASSEAIAEDIWRCDANIALHKESHWILLSASFFEYDGRRLSFEQPSDFYLRQVDGDWQLSMLGVKKAILVESSLMPSVKALPIVLEPGVVIKNQEY